MSSVLKVVGASWLQTKISSYILGFLGILAILALFVGQMERIQADGNYAATVFYSEKTGYRIEYWGQSNELADIPRGVARAHFRRDVVTTGWSLLEVETNSSYPDEIQAYAAGVVEGALTWLLIHTHLENTVRDKCDGTPLERKCNKLMDHLDKSADIWKKYASEHEDDPFWHQVSLYYTQIQGIFTGWKHGVERSMKEYETDISELYWLNSMSEMPELQRKLNLTIDNTTYDHWPDVSSAFVKVVNETADGHLAKKIYMAHNAAGSYSSMTRILKRYKLQYHRSSSRAELVAGAAVDFSGYPGAVSSHDEFYIISGDHHRMAVTGTALRNYNPHLWKDVNITEQVPIGPRVSAANRLSCNGSAWARTLAASNSGTASKQWLVLDYGALDRLRATTPRAADVVTQRTVDVVTQRAVDKHVRHTVVHGRGAGGVLTLVEQAPARTHSVDLTARLLQHGYWAALGVPYFKDVAESTHTHEMEKLHGSIFSEAQSPRAQFFRRGQVNATSADGVIRLMRTANASEWNQPEGVEWALLGPRGDVAPYKQPYGVIDTKLVSGTQNSSKLEFIAISGPPFTEVVTPNTTRLNRGNLAPIYLEHLNNRSDINGLEVRDLVKHFEQAEKESLDSLNKDAVKPFQWSKSPFANASHTELPDKWDFGPYKPKWSW